VLLHALYWREVTAAAQTIFVNSDQTYSRRGHRYFLGSVKPLDYFLHRLVEPPLAEVEFKRFQQITNVRVHKLGLF